MVDRLRRTWHDVRALLGGALPTIWHPWGQGPDGPVEGSDTSLQTVFTGTTLPERPRRAVLPVSSAPTGLDLDEETTHA